MKRLLIDARPGKDGDTPFDASRRRSHFAMVAAVLGSTFDSAEHAFVHRVFSCIDNRVQMVSVLAAAGNEPLQIIAGAFGLVNGGSHGSHVLLACHLVAARKQWKVCVPSRRFPRAGAEEATVVDAYPEGRANVNEKSDATENGGSRKQGLESLAPVPVDLMNYHLGAVSFLRI
ncbi:hypothetical protein HPB50_020143 [Hyalomma asiaticum]|uniref:Uncharacterized protein n=1 Tax=Hyalomma asiaticum TaxID=266040 RepID=A0ACB7S448_HYAAI|nr:hypothetical protein HPB50_020143 [Hyalomma asiaticum]